MATGDYCPRCRGTHDILMDCPPIQPGVPVAGSITHDLLQARGERDAALLKLDEATKAIRAIAPYCKVKYGMDEEAVAAIEKIADKPEPSRKDKCADCGHARESHDYSGCLIWINADAKSPCLCKVWKENANLRGEPNEAMKKVVAAAVEFYKVRYIKSKDQTPDYWKSAAKFDLALKDYTEKAECQVALPLLEGNTTVCGNVKPCHMHG